MKLRNKILVSLIAGLIATLLYSGPMWWGVLFSSIAQPLTAGEPAEDRSGLCWEVDGTELRLKSVDIMTSIFHPDRP